MQMREKVGKSRNTVFFQWFVAPEGRKVGSLKRRVRSHLARWEMQNCTPLWREAHFQVKMYKTHQVRTTFGSWDVKKSARRCGAKHISKSKCWKHQGFGPLLEVQMSFRLAGGRDCAPCQKYAVWGFCSIFNYNHHYTTLHSNTLHYITLHYTTLHLHYTTLHYTRLHYIPLHYTTLCYIPLHYTTLTTTTTTTTTTILHLHYATLHYTNYTALH